ncbi:MAG: protein kinase, partial [Acetatifactor sp.]|nr:protein kinase [Acetatifactor sp.]
MERVLKEHGFLRRQLLGRGGFSRVYCVEEAASGRRYACKVSENVALLKREALFLRRALHPLFPSLREWWVEDKAGYLVTDFVPGGSLEALLERRGGFSEAQAVRIGMELAEGLLFLHEGAGGLIFRDVKPANIMIREDGRIKLLDFGCACE